MSNQAANIELMTQAARSAARTLMRDFLEVENLQVSRKGPSDFVSKADQEAEKIIREILNEARPNYGWLCEETGQSEGSDPTRRWIVDPLDGTTNYLHGLPHWCISIALEQKGEIVAAVIFDPVKSELFRAEKGGGAWLNDRRIRVSGRRDFEDMIFATGLPFNQRGDIGRTLKELSRILPECAGIRRLGAAALDLAYVAAGRYDGYWEDMISTWDIAAGVLLVREAGGFAHAYDRSQEPHMDETVIAAHPDVIEKFTSLIKG